MKKLLCKILGHRWWVVAIRRRPGNPTTRHILRECLRCGHNEESYEVMK